MVTFLTRLLLVVQLLMVFGMAGGMHHLGWMPFWPSLLVAAGLLALLRLGFVLNNFRLCARLARGKLPSITWQNFLKMVLREYWASMVSSSWTMPFPKRIKASTATVTGTPVLLIHGYGCNQGFWRPMRRALERAGIGHAAIDMEPILAGIEAHLPRVDAAVRALTQNGRIVLVAHSMGGLVARAYVRRYGSVRLARIITLGTPHYGTALAHLSPGENCRQMRRSECRTRSCAWLAELAESETPETRELIVSIYSRHDNIIVPPDSSLLEGARNIAFDAIGHVELPSSKEIQSLVVKLIEEVGEPSLIGADPQLLNASR